MSFIPEQVLVLGTRYTSPIIKVVTGTDPVANTETSDTVPAGKAWLLLGYSVQMVQGATQTPWPSLILDDGTSTLFQAFSGTAAQSAGVTTQHSWGVNVPATGSAATTANTGPLPFALLLPAGYRCRTSTTGIGANSNYGAPKIFVAEYQSSV